MLLSWAEAERLFFLCTQGSKQTTSIMMWSLFLASLLLITVSLINMYILYLFLNYFIQFYRILWNPFRKTYLSTISAIFIQYPTLIVCGIRPHQLFICWTYINYIIPVYCLQKTILKCARQYCVHMKQNFCDVFYSCNSYTQFFQIPSWRN